MRPARLLPLVVSIGCLAFAPIAPARPPRRWSGQRTRPAASRPSGAGGRVRSRHPAAHGRGFLLAAEQGDYGRAVEYLNLTYLPRRYRDQEPENLARDANLVLERLIWIDIGALSDAPEGMSGDGLPTNREAIGTIKTSDGEIALYVERIAREDGELIWKLTSGTVVRLNDQFEHVEYPAFIQAIAAALPEVSFLGLELFKWVIGLGVMGGVYILFYVVVWIGMGILSRSTSPTRIRVHQYISGPIAALIAVLAGNWVVDYLGMGVTAQRITRANTMGTIIGVWVVFAGVNLIRDVIAHGFESRGRAPATVLLRPIATSVKIVICLAAMLLWLDNVGFNISTLLAGLGIGGLALALALQKTLEDLFRAVTLFIQQPVRVNDFCRFGDKLGTVEEIGLRTTRIRTLDNTLLSVPNSRFAQEYIENISARGRIRYRSLVRLRYDSTHGQIDDAISRIRSLIGGTEHVDREVVRVRLTELGTFGADIEAIAQIQTTDYNQFLETAERINLGIVRSVAEAGTHFAAPLDRPAA